jgi:outer membrane protein OmpA-like peptidoglycan-associated protein
MSTTMGDARARLVTALASPEAAKKPAEAAKAQTNFDCWMEQHHHPTHQQQNPPTPNPNHTPQPPMAPEKVAEVKTPEQQMVHFKFDSTELTAKSQSEMEQIVRDVQLAKPKSVQIQAYTDLSGDKMYNAKLAAMRGKTIEDKLKDAGAEVIQVDARGAVDPIVDTPKPNEENRRAVIIFN